MQGDERMLIINTENLLKSMFQCEQAELFSKAQTEFWRDMLWEVLKDYTFRSDFYLVRQDFEYREVVEYLKNLISDACQKYGLGYFVTESSYRAEVKMRFHNYGILKTMYDELSIVICKDVITMRMLPHSPLIKVYPLEDYQLVGKLAQLLCEKIFVEKLEDFVAYLETFKKIEDCSKGMNFKSVEIAKTSIKTIYEASDEKFKNITQKNLYSSMFFKGKRFQILHRDFLADPNVLISQLK